MADSPNSNSIICAPLTWRSTSPLHKVNHGQSIRSLVNFSAGVPKTIANFKYGSETIDRIIGMMLNCQTPGAVSFTINEVCGWQMNPAVATNFGTLYTNVETLVDGINLTVTASANVTCNISLWNFEVGTSHIGHI